MSQALLIKKCRTRRPFFIPACVHKTHRRIPAASCKTPATQMQAFDIGTTTIVELDEHVYRASFDIAAGVARSLDSETVIAMPMGILQTFTAIHGPSIVSRCLGISTGIHMKENLQAWGNNRPTIDFVLHVDENGPDHELTITCKDRSLPDCDKELYEAHPFMCKIKMDYMDMACRVTSRAHPMEVVRKTVADMGLKLVVRPDGFNWEQLSLKILDDGQVWIPFSVFRIHLAFLHALILPVGGAQNPDLFDTVTVEKFGQIPRIGKVMK